MNMKYYLAYGSNLNIAQMKRRCPGAKIIGTAVIPDYRLMFKGSQTGSYLTIEPWKGKRVPVAVWAVTDQDEKNLDRYEGFPAFYYKREMNVRVDGQPFDVRAFVYIMHEDRPHGIPSEYYVWTCLDGYASFGFNPKTLKEAYAFSAKRAKKVVDKQADMW